MSKALALLFLSTAGFAGPTSLFEAVRSGDSKAVSVLLRAGANPDIRDEYGATPLLYATAYGSVNDMALLLRSGADVNAKTTAGSTALMWATADPRKVRLLLKAGADVNANSSSGMTAFLSAVFRENLEVVRILTEAGADRNAEAALIPNAPIRLGLRRLAYSTNESTLRSLLTERPSLQELIALAGSVPMSGLFVMTGFSMRRRTAPGIEAGVRAMLELGADPNQPVRQLVRTLSPLALAASFGDAAGVRLLLEKGANPNATGSLDITPLMIAASAEDLNLESVRVLVDAGAKLDAKDKVGRTALDWALMQGESPVSQLLRERGAVPGGWRRPAPAAVAAPREVRQAIELALQQLGKSGPEFHRQAACISCHHQSLAAVAMKIAGRPNPASDATIGMWAPSRENFLAGNCSIFGFLGNVSYGLFAMAEEGRAPNAVTDAAASCLSSLQWPDGRWEGGDMRPPLAGRLPLVYTALGVRALKTYLPDGGAGQIAKAREFLENAGPSDTQGESFRLLGLVWGGSGRERIRKQAEKVAALQKPDGGWSQRPTMQSDAYATGQSMYALHVARSSTALRRGAQYLLRTQLEDGTWFVPSRTVGFQPHIETGFPHGKDQFISAAATAWAAIALGVMSSEERF